MLLQAVVLCHSYLTNVKGYMPPLKAGKGESIGASEEELNEVVIDKSMKDDVIEHLRLTDVEDERSIPFQLICQRGQVVKGASQARSTAFESH